MDSINLTQDLSTFYQRVVEYKQLSAEHLLSILGPMNAKLENSVTLLDSI